MSIYFENKFIAKFVADCTSFTIKSSIFPKEYIQIVRASYRKQSFGESLFCLKRVERIVKNSKRIVAQGNAGIRGLSSISDTCLTY